MCSETLPGVYLDSLLAKIPPPERDRFFDIFNHGLQLGAARLPLPAPSKSPEFDRCANELHSVMTPHDWQRLVNLFNQARTDEDECWRSKNVREHFPQLSSPCRLFMTRIWGP